MHPSPWVFSAISTSISTIGLRTLRSLGRNYESGCSQVHSPERDDIQTQKLLVVGGVEIGQLCSYQFMPNFLARALIAAVLLASADTTPLNNEL